MREGHKRGKIKDLSKMKEEQDLPNLHLSPTTTLNNIVHKRNGTEEGAIELRTLSIKEKKNRGKTVPIISKQL